MFKKLMASADRTEVGFCQGVLEAEGLRCFIKNEFLGGASGELPVNETWPELWVSKDDFSRAEEILSDLKPEPDAKPWQCTECGELIEAQFSDCWRCSASAVVDK